MKIFKKIFMPLLLVVVGLIAHGNTLLMYFWQDDSALIFKLQNPIPPAGSFGAGIIGEGPYKYLVTPFVPFFPLFGKNPFGYFAVGLVTFLLTIGVVYFFAREFFKNKNAGYMSAFIYASGYLGSDTMFRIINSWQTNIGLIMAISSFWAFTRYSNTKRTNFYFLSLFLFYLSTEFVFVRSHSLIFVFLAIDLFLNFEFDKRINKVSKLLLRQFPFWFVFYFKYLKNGGMGGNSLSSLVKALFSGRLEILSGLFANIGNIFVPNVIQEKLITLYPFMVNKLFFVAFLFIGIFLLRKLSKSKKAYSLWFVALLLSYFLDKYFYTKNLYWFRDPKAFLSASLGLYITAATLIFSYNLWLNGKKRIASGISVGYLIAASQIFGYYIQYTDAIFATHHRYLTYSSMGYALFIGAGTFALFENYEQSKSKLIRLLALTPLLVIIISNLYLLVKYEREIVKDRSIPTRQFYRDLQKYSPTLKKDSVVFFDVQNESFYLNQFGNFFSVGSMPEETALAIYYDRDREDFKMVTSLDELLFLLSTGTKTENVYSFYYGEDGLVSTTKSLRASLISGKGAVPVSPMSMVFELEVHPDNDVKYPIFANKKGYSEVEVNQFVDFINFRKTYYEKVSAQSISEWKGQEVEYAVDNDPNTSWRGHRIHWHENESDQLLIDSGTIQKISSVAWVNLDNTLSPTQYSIELSTNKKDWVKVKEVANGKELTDGQLVVENFDPASTRYIRFSFESTLSNDSPAISEVLAIPERFSKIDLKRLKDFEDNPFANIGSNAEMLRRLTKVEGLVNFRISVVTDKGSSNIDTPLKTVNGGSRYEIVYPGGGTHIKEIVFDPINTPITIKSKKTTLRNLSFEEIKSRNLIPRFSKN